MKKTNVLGIFVLMIIALESCKDSNTQEEVLKKELKQIIEKDSVWEDEQIMQIDSFLTKNSMIIELGDPISDSNFTKMVGEEANTSTSIENQDENDYLYCVRGSSRSPNYVLEGNGRKMYITFTGADWSGIRNTCGNYRPSNRKFTFPDSRVYQYQMVLFEEAPAARNYYVNICEEGVTYSLNTKRGFKYYVYTNDTSGDHDNNRGSIYFCYGQ